MKRHDTERPEWFDKHPSEWPESARTFYRLMATGAQRAAAKREATQRHGDSVAS